MKLACLIGTWNAADLYEKTALTPDGGTGSGVYNTVFGPGDFSILTDYRYYGPHGETGGHQVLTWDAQNRRPVVENGTWAARWEQRSHQQGRPNQIQGWAGGDAGSVVVPPDYQRLAGAWTNGQDPAPMAGGGGN